MKNMHVFTKKRLLVNCLLVLMSVICCAFAVSLYIYSSESRGLNATSTEANQILFQKFQIPSNAKKICYITTASYSRVNFFLNREEVLKWAESMHLVMREIDADHPGTFFDIDKNFSINYNVVSKGFNFYTNDICGFNGSFDEINNKCCVVYSCR